MGFPDLVPDHQGVGSNRINDHHRLLKTRRWLIQAVLLLVLVGSICRFVSLDGRFYWHDEIMTFVRTAGHNPELIKSQLDNRLLEFQELSKFQNSLPGSNVGEMIDFLAVQDAKHPPLYFTLVWMWRQLVGNSLIWVRLFSALVSLLIFPALYWLGIELFANTTVSTMIVGSVALSPIHLLFAQEARAYSLWTLLIVASSAALLRALKRRTATQWGIYIVLSIMGLYTQLLFALVLAGHGIYVVAMCGSEFRTSRERVFKLMQAYAAVIGLISLAFLPWVHRIIQIVATLKSNTAWAFEPISKGFLVKKWLIMYGATFVDWDGWILSKPNSLINYAPKIGVVLMSLFALYFVCRRTEKRIWLFLVSLIAPFVICLMLPDLILSGQRSIGSRYFLGVFIALQIAVAYLFAIKIFSKNARTPYLWKFGLICLLVLQISSCTSILQSQVWWTKFYNLVPAADLINRDERTLVVSDPQIGANFGTLIALSNRIKSGVNLQLAHFNNPPSLPTNFERILLFSTSDPSMLLSAYQDTYTAEQVPNSEGLLWQMDPK